MKCNLAFCAVAVLAVGCASPADDDAESVDSSEDAVTVPIVGCDLTASGMKNDGTYAIVGSANVNCAAATVGGMRATVQTVIEVESATVRSKVKSIPAVVSVPSRPSGSTFSSKQTARLTITNGGFFPDCTTGCSGISRFRVRAVLSYEMPSGPKAVWVYGPWRTFGTSRN